METSFVTTMSSIVTKKEWCPPRYVIYGVSMIAHFVLILFGSWQDANFTVKYSDIDYEVFTDAANYVRQNDSPYKRHTYRAYLLVPNILCFKSFGKLIFSLIDVTVGLVLEKLLVLKGCPSSLRDKLLLLWLWNPVVLQVSTRGNADALPVLFVLLTLLALRKKQWIASGILFGMSVHLKIFPAIMGLPCLLFINPHYLNGRSFSPKLLVNLITSLSIPQWLFGGFSLVTFFGLGGIFYMLYGYVFLFEAYVYHLIRIDHRHNFSPFFYLLYLTQLTPSYNKIISLITFLPQVRISTFFALMMPVLFYQWFPTLWVGCRYARQDLESSIFLQILIFVIFNKVCTVQYFLWWMGLLPLICDTCVRYNNRNVLSFVKSTCICIGIWCICQGIWLYWGYQLEFLGRPVFLQIWGAGLTLFISGIVLTLNFLFFLKRFKLNK